MARTGKNNPPRTVSVTTSATLLSDATQLWASRVIRNTDASVSVYMGDSTVTSSGGTKGFELKAGEIFTEDVISDRIYAVTASGTVSVLVWEFGG